MSAVSAVSQTDGRTGSRMMLSPNFNRQPAGSPIHGGGEYDHTGNFGGQAVSEAIVFMETVRELDEEDVYEKELIKEELSNRLFKLNTLKASIGKSFGPGIYSTSLIKDVLQS